MNLSPLNAQDAQIARIVDLPTQFRETPESLLALAETAYAAAGRWEALAIMADGRDPAHAAQDRAHAQDNRERGRELTRRALMLQLNASLTSTGAVS